ncbi:HAD family hydrolase [Vallitalea pronyensis]|uniref:HAD family hydrolase n=1 Tax=Vallitalea pronyensis TaxID=1348613 RepID=A0A8J8ML88_9FIRM|nr:HAD family hydrolase [Vallitalea pronyensis]QUI23571.1 HAD family hydrolase [Vallitalea pronyensis]
MNTILFDLDGTLLPLDEKIFVDTYFDALHRTFEDKMDKKTFVNYIWGATAHMRDENDEERTNQELFMDKFATFVGDEMDEYKERFDRFYETGFLEVEKAVSKSQYVIDAIKLLKEKGYTIVLATNPLFPLTAVHHRIHWAGLQPEDFEHITAYENSHYCKPYTAYYEEILTHIDKQPDECMMIGNDVQEDLVAGKLGLKTFLVENHLINRNNDTVDCTLRGNYEDLFEYVASLPHVNG